MSVEYKRNRDRPFPGLQGTERVGAFVDIHTFKTDPVLPMYGNSNPISFVGKHERDLAPMVTAVNTHKDLENPGSFSMECKCSFVNEDATLEDVVQDDDWIDISLARWGDVHHVMRGLIDDIRLTEMTGANGVTTKSYTITGSEFASIWQRTPVYFNRYIGEDAGGGATLRALTASGKVFGSVSTTVDAFLSVFLQEFDGKGAPSWEFPPTLIVPGVGDEDRYFRNGVRFFFDGYLDDPPRHSLNAAFISSNGRNLWDLAREWCDPQFCEMYPILLDKDGSYPDPEDALSHLETQMAIVLRDRPFPITSEGIATAQSDLNSPWFGLPEYRVNRQEVQTWAIGKTGRERKNAFFASPQVQNEQSRANIELEAALWDIKDIKRHGFRRLDAQTNYTSTTAALATFAEGQRSRLRDWFAINPYLYNGTLPLSHLRPEIQIGTKIRVPGIEEDGSLDWQFYVEAVDNSWTAPGHGQTTLTVTRGWHGKDNDLMNAVRTLQGRYSLATRSKAGE